jgi:hypothetical protein
MTVRGDFIDGSRVIYRMYNGRLCKGLEFNDGRSLTLHTGEFDDFSSGLALVDTGFRKYYINRLGEEVITGDFVLASSFSEERAWIEKNNRITIIDTKGRRIKEFEGTPIMAPFHNGLAKLSEMKDRAERIISGYIDKEGSLVVPMIEEFYPKSPADIMDSEDDYYSDGLIRFYKDGFYGFIDRESNFMIPPVYDNVSCFVNGVAAARIVDVSGFIDKDCKVIIPFQFEAARRFSTLGIAPVKLKGKWGAIDIEGNTAVPFGYDSLQVIVNAFLLFKTGDKYGIMDKDLQIIIEPRYNYIQSFSEGICRFTQSGRFGVVDRFGNELIDPEVNAIGFNWGN